MHDYSRRNARIILSCLPVTLFRTKLDANVHKVPHDRVENQWKLIHLNSAINWQTKYPSITASLASMSRWGIPRLQEFHNSCLYSSSFQAALPISNKIIWGFPSTSHVPVTTSKIINFALYNAIKENTNIVFQLARLVKCDWM